MTLSAGIEVRADGSGTVHAGVGFDDDARGRIGDLAAALRADDLRSAGWAVVGPTPEDDGLTWLRASKGFDDADEAAAVAAQLSGPDGPFRDFRVTRDRSLLHTRTMFTGEVDLRRGLAGLNDADLQAAVGDFDLGLDPATLGDQVRVEVRVDLPGEVEVGPGGAATVDGRAVWTPALGERVVLAASSDLRRLGPLVYGSLALVAVAAALAGVVLRRRVRRRKALAQR